MNTEQNIKKPLVVLSLFDGISCGQIALDRLNIDYVYYASEIEKPSIAITHHNYPNTIQIGDVRNIKFENGTLYTDNGDFYVADIDLLIGGSPCQTVSLANGGGR